MWQHKHKRLRLVEYQQSCVSKVLNLMGRLWYIMIYHWNIVILHISYHLISSNYHQGSTGRTLWWGLCPLTAENSPACDEEGWLAVHHEQLMLDMFNLFKGRGKHRTNELFVNYYHSKIYLQDASFPPFKSSIYIKGLGAPYWPLAHLCDSLVDYLTHSTCFAHFDLCTCRCFQGK